ncbi:Os03g0856600 [Oryza sativa Japonica Group]|uniref:Os03g0856600 protein n=1 Tax=Oryza sativa subsp. japonica TaxID=39947 RepID=A0A0P0W5T0_ORYSJ|nr:Os03g0856600 [Oryza sativa Japonica Group]
MARSLLSRHLPSWPPASSVPAASMPACHNHHILLQQRAIHLPIEALQPWHAMEKMSCLLILAIEVAATNTLLGGSGTHRSTSFVVVPVHRRRQELAPRRRHHNSSHTCLPELLSEAAVHRNHTGLIG